MAARKGGVHATRSKAGALMQVKNSERSKGVALSRPALKHRATGSVSAEGTQKTVTLIRPSGHNPFSGLAFVASGFEPLVLVSKQYRTNA